MRFELYAYLHFGHWNLEFNWNLGFGIWNLNKLLLRFAFYALRFLLRVSYNGNTPASQAGDEGSIPSTRIKKAQSAKLKAQSPKVKNSSLKIKKGGEDASD